MSEEEVKSEEAKREEAESEEGKREEVRQGSASVAEEQPTAAEASVEEDFI